VGNGIPAEEPPPLSRACRVAKQDEGAECSACFDLSELSRRQHLGLGDIGNLAIIRPSPRPSCPMLRGCRFLGLIDAPQAVTSTIDPGIVFAFRIGSIH
jgi:hypothetical protein